MEGGGGRLRVHHRLCGGQLVLANTSPFFHGNDFDLLPFLAGHHPLGMK